MIYLQLLWTFIKIGILGFGGGYAMLSMIMQEVVEENAWMTSAEFADMVAISQMTPGPVSINIATYVGYEVAGYWGAALSTVALCLPSMLLVILVAHFLFNKKYKSITDNALKILKPAIAGLILSAGIAMMNANNFTDVGLHNYNISIVICVLSFVASYFFKANPIILIVAAGVAGYVVY